MWFAIFASTLFLQHHFSAVVLGATIDDYPACQVSRGEHIGDGNCDGWRWGGYNTEECGWDGGDCLVPDYPDCRGLDQPSKIGDGYCDGGKYNTAECGWDGGDCIEFNMRYPACFTEYPSMVGDGFCSGPANNKECDWEGGDCDVFNEKYPDCKMGDRSCASFNATYPGCIVDDPEWVGNGFCQYQFNTAECGWDGGDCDEFNKYPACHVDHPSLIGNSHCDNNEFNSEYNSVECGWDGGDCIEANKLNPPPGWPAGPGDADNLVSPQENDIEPKAADGDGDAALRFDDDSSQITTFSLIGTVIVTTTAVALSTSI